MRSALLVLPLLLLAACLSDVGDPVEPFFGAPYTLTNNGEYPSLRNDTVFVRVGYSGCGGGHPFVVRSRIFADRADLWLMKDNRNEPCDAYFEEVVTLPLGDLKTIPHITVLGPAQKNISLR